MRDWQDYMDEFAGGREDENYPPWWFWEERDETTNRNIAPPSSAVLDEGTEEYESYFPYSGLSEEDMAWWADFFSDFFKKQYKEGFGLSDEEMALRRTEAEDYIWDMRDKFIAAAQRDLPATGRMYGGTGSGYYADIDEAALREMQRRYTEIEKMNMQREYEELWRWLASAMGWFTGERGYGLDVARLNLAQESDLRAWLATVMSMM